MTRKSSLGPRTRTVRGAQRGGFGLGMVVGLLVGLALALGVALYVSKVPVPFIDKVPQRTAEQDAAETEKNRNWDPNAPLAGKTSPVRPAVEAASAVVAPAASAGPVASAPATAVPPAGKASERSAKAGADPFLYFVQVGAYAKPEDAEQQRAKLTIAGLDAKITEREQKDKGSVVYRVRLGPFDTREDADKTREMAIAEGYVGAALVRLAR